MAVVGLILYAALVHRDGGRIADTFASGVGGKKVSGIFFFWQICPNQSPPKAFLSHGFCCRRGIFLSEDFSVVALFFNSFSNLIKHV